MSAYPDGSLSDGGVWPDILDVGSEERQQALTALLRDFIADPALSAQDLHDRCTPLAFYDYDVRAALRGLSPEPSPRLVDTARQLDFSYPAEARWGDPSVTFRLGIDVGDRDPEVIADDVIAMLRASGPKETVEMVGVDSKAGAQHWGLVHRPSTLKFY